MHPSLSKPASTRLPKARQEPDPAYPRMNYVLTYRIPEGSFRDILEAPGGGETVYVEAHRMRRMRLRDILKELRIMRGKDVIIAVEHDGSRPVVGVLITLALLARSKSMRVVWPDCSVEPVSRRRTASILQRIVATQMRSRLAYHRSARWARRLARPGPPTPLLTAGDAQRILYMDANLTFGLQAGGSLGHTRGVIDAFVGRGYAVDYASIKPIPTDAAGVDWLRIPVPELYSFPPELNYYAFNDQYERFVRAELARRPYAFLYQRMSLHNFSGARLRAEAKIPLVLEYNGSEAWASANWDRRLQLHDMAVSSETAALRQADLVVTVSDVLGEHVAELGIPRDRIVIYPNCIDPVIFDPRRFSEAENHALRGRLGIPTGAKVATFVGTFGTWHGVDFLARAIRRLLDRERDWVDAHGLRFLLVGDGLKMPEVREALGAEPYSHYVTLAGLVPQKHAAAYLAASDVFLSPHMPNKDGSAFFGSPTKLFEYMAMGRPIIAADLDQIGAVLKGRSGNAEADARPLAALFAPGDEEGFLSALRAVVSDPEGARRLAARARSAALASYTWDHHVGAIMERMAALGMLDRRGASPRDREGQV